MVFCDIDGTLIDSAHQISRETIQKIQELYCEGIPFILVSARMPSGIFPLQKVLGICAPIVCYSGALILNSKGNPVKTVGIGLTSLMLFQKHQLQVTSMLILQELQQRLMLKNLLLLFVKKEQIQHLRRFLFQELLRV